MNDAISEYLSKYPDDVRSLFGELRTVLFACAENADERPWAKLPSYFVGERFVRLIPFRDHVNIEAAAVAAHTAELDGYKLTTKGMLQVFVWQELPRATLEAVFRETLCGL